MSKRLVDEGWKKAFKAEACDGSCVQPLSAIDRDRVQEYLTSNTSVLAEFEAFEPGELNFVMELRFNVVPPKDIESFQALASQTFAGIEVNGSTNTEILQRIASSPLVALQSEGLSNVTLRFLCRNYELREGEFVFRIAEVAH